MILFLGAVIGTAFVTFWIISLGSFFAKQAGRTNNPVMLALAPLAIPLTVVVFLAVAALVILIPR